MSYPGQAGSSPSRTIPLSIRTSYDPTGQLTGATYTGGQANESYSYDANGNRTTAGYVIGKDNRLLSDGTYTYSYDADGNRTARYIDANHDGVLDAGDTQITVYGWDVRNRLTSVTTYATFGGSPTQTVTYLYDVENRLIGETVSAPGQRDHQTRFAYDGNQIALQFDKDGGGAVSPAKLSHRYLSGQAVDQVFADEQITNPHKPGTVVSPLADNLGSIHDLAILDVLSGLTRVANHRVYDSFGNLKSQTNAAVDCVFGFTGFLTDKATGLDMSETRPYDPRTGRWEQPDWTDLLGRDTNRYRYCGNSPTNATDPGGCSNPNDPWYKRWWDNTKEFAEHFWPVAAQGGQEAALEGTHLPGVPVDIAIPVLEAAPRIGHIAIGAGARNQGITRGSSGSSCANELDFFGNKEYNSV